MIKEGITHVNLDKDYILKPIKKEYVSKPNFRMFGIIKETNMDLMDYSHTVSKAESEVLLLIKNSISWSVDDNEFVPIVELKPSKMNISDSKKNTMSKAMMKLRNNDIIRKVKPFHYMIDPSLLVPANFEKYNKIWNKLTGPKHKN